MNTNEQSERPMLTVANLDDIAEMHKRTSAGEWRQGTSSHNTVAKRPGQPDYRIADFHHADDASFVDVAHRHMPALVELARAALASQQPAAVRPGSPEASAMIDSVLAEYQWPTNPKNAARAGFVACQRLLASSPAQPQQGDDLTVNMMAAGQHALIKTRNAAEVWKAMRAAQPPAPPQQGDSLSAPEKKQ